MDTSELERLGIVLLYELNRVGINTAQLRGQEAKIAAKILRCYLAGARSEIESLLPEK